MKIGFVGQGFIGKNLANNFETRGYKDIVRYSLESEYVSNKDKIKECDVVFFALPTPTTQNGFDDSILVNTINEVTKEGQIIVVKSTVIPNTLRDLSCKHKDRIILHSPEFLTEATAREDTDNPERNIIGIATDADTDVAKSIIAILPKAPYNTICSYEESSLIKYAGNCYFYVKNMFFNIMFDLAVAYNCSYDVIREAVINDSRIHRVHTEPTHKNGRGAGGDCLVKDFATLRQLCIDSMLPLEFLTVIRANEKMNIALLKSSNKDLDILHGVYGEDV